VERVISGLPRVSGEPVIDGPRLLGTGATSEVSLLVVCLVAFLGVMALLSLLSVVILGLTRVFPPRGDGVEWATRRAVELAIERRFPGARLAEMRPSSNEGRDLKR